MSTSFQLPDLSALIQAAKFNLRTNPSCSLVLLASNQYVSASIDLDEVRMQEAKVALFAALCFPTCDAPQLRVAMDAMSFLILGQQEFVHHRKWLWAEGAEPESDWEKMFQGHLYLRHSVSSLRHLLSQNPETALEWGRTFTERVGKYKTSQRKILDDGIASDTQAYLKLRRDSSGWALAFSLIGLLNSLHIEALRLEQSDLLEELQMHAANILVIAEDIVSFNSYQSHTSPPLPNYNLVSILLDSQTTDVVSLQMAINDARDHIGASIQGFTDAEKSLLQTFGTHSDRWYNRLNPFDAGSSQQEDDIKLYIQGLRDCIAGFVNWVFETELYFGKRGEEVREFGWIFLKEKA